MASAGGDTLDFLVYSDDWHYPLLSITKGVSLERMRVTGPTQSADNWHSAAATVGYASPGLLNSQALADQTGVGELLLEPEVFSPDNDGKRRRVADSLAVPRCRSTRDGGHLRPAWQRGGPAAGVFAGGTDHVLTWNGVGANGRLVAEGCTLSDRIVRPGRTRESFEKAVVVLRKVEGFGEGRYFACS